MGLSIYPAPEDSGVVGPTGATGPQGPKGDPGTNGTNGAPGAAGSKVLTGTTAPTSGVGVDGDIYIQDDTRTYLGITSTTLTHWKKTAGTWAQVGTVGGSKWYTNNTSTSSADTKPGDMLLRTDTGDVWQRGVSGWGTAIMNLKGPKGDPGTNGLVTSVNGKSASSITLTAADVNAMPTSGGTFTGDFSLNGASGAYRQWSLDVGGVKRWTFQKDDVAEAGDGSGSNFRLSSRNDDGTFKSTIMYGDRGTGQVAIGTTSAHGDAKLTAAGSIGAKDIATDPTGPATGIHLYSKAGKPYIRKGDGTVFEVGTGGDGLPLTGGTVTGPVVIQPTSGHPLTAYGSSDASTYFRVTDAGHPYSNSTRATFYNVGVGDTTSPFGGGVRVLGMQNASTVPSTNPSNGVVAYAEGGEMKVRQGDGRIVNVGGGTRNSWTPQSLGFQAWSHDPATIPNAFDWKAYIDSNGVTQRNALKAAVIGRMYLAGINITEPTTVSKVVVFARGWGGSTILPNTRFFAGIYNEAGSRVAWTGSTALGGTANPVPGAGQEPGTPTDITDNHTGAVPFNLTASYVMQPGRYWAAFLVSAGSATDFYYHFVENWAVSAPANFHLLGTAFMRAAHLNSQTSLPASFTKTSVLTSHDPIVMALA
ncbi:hypothetical protein [Streptomyces sp. NPDC054849]